MKYSVYQIMFSWGEYYIGRTSKSPEERVDEHYTGDGSPEVQRAYVRERQGDRWPYYPVVDTLATFDKEQDARDDEERRIREAKERHSTLCLNRT